MSTVKTGLSVAAAAALLALAGVSVPGASVAKDSTVHCYGANACKGQSDCKSGKHDCKAMNDCKGQGFKDLSSAACTKAGGSVTPPK